MSLIGLKVGYVYYTYGGIRVKMVRTYHENVHNGRYSTRIIFVAELVGVEDAERLEAILNATRMRKTQVSGLYRANDIILYYEDGSVVDRHHAEDVRAIMKIAVPGVEMTYSKAIELAAKVGEA